MHCDRTSREIQPTGRFQTRNKFIMSLLMLNRVLGKFSRALFCAAFLSTVFGINAASPPEPTCDVAAIDRERILSAAAAALNIEPLTITKFRAKLSEGGPNDFYSNADYFW